MTTLPDLIRNIDPDNQYIRTLTQEQIGVVSRRNNMEFRKALIAYENGDYDDNIELFIEYLTDLMERNIRK